MKDLSELFDPEPLEWGLRGDPWVWQALRDHLTGTYLPPSAGEIASILYAAFDRLVAVDLATEPESSVYRAEFARDDGRSSGYVSLDVWRGRLMPLLIDRGVELL
jgi:hypothetical protein